MHSRTVSCEELFTQFSIAPASKSLAYGASVSTARVGDTVVQTYDESIQLRKRIFNVKHLLVYRDDLGLDIECKLVAGSV
jgi:hypothetical protein